MYSYNEFERLFWNYKLEGVPSGISIEQFCLSHNVPFNLFEKCYKDTRKKDNTCPSLGYLSSGGGFGRNICTGFESESESRFPGSSAY